MRKEKVLVKQPTDKDQLCIQTLYLNFPTVLDYDEIRNVVIVYEEIYKAKDLLTGFVNQANMNNFKGKKSSLGDAHYITL